MKRAMGRFSRILRASACGTLALAVGLMGILSAEAKPVSGVSVSTYKANLQLRAGVNARSFQSMTRRGWRYQARVWYHKGKSWRLLYKLPLRRASLSMRYAKSRLCSGHKGRVVVQMAIGRQLRGSWWNSATRKYQKSFYPYQHQMHVVTCNMVINRSRRGFRAKPKAGTFGRAGSVRRPAAGRAPKAAGRYGNAWRKAGRYGNAWRGLGQFKARYGNAWRSAGKKKGRYGNAWRR